MKSLDYPTLKSYAHWLTASLKGARLQEVWTDGQRVIFEFYLRQNYYLVADLHPQSPHVVFLPEPPAMSKKPKPVTLFLQSHARNLYVQNFSTKAESGRVLFLELGSQDQICRIEFRLIPKAVNLIVESSGKVISWERPRSLPESKVETNERAIVVTSDWVTQYAEEWQGGGKKNSLQSQSQLLDDPVRKIESEIRKKESAIQKIQTELEKNQEHQYQKLGEILKYSSEIPEELKPYYDAQKTVAENRERAFQKAKDLVRKRQGSIERQNILKKEITALREKIEKKDFTTKASTANEVLKKSDSQARKRTLSSGFEAVIGKTWKDNLAILRQARAWDYWVHLKDYPSAHAILFRNKNEDIPDSAFEELTMWIIQESLGKKRALQDLKFDVVAAECRFVRPVKGAQGLVTYQNQKNFTFRVKAS